MAGLFRAFLFAPRPQEHARYRRSLERMVSGLSDAVVMESAYRHSNSRQTAFAFAQGTIVGAMGNLFASGLGHFIDDPSLRDFGPRDAAWALVAILSLGTIVSMTAGAIRRFRQNTQVEAIFLREVHRRHLMTEGPEDPDEFAPTNV